MVAAVIAGGSMVDRGRVGDDRGRSTILGPGGAPGLSSLPLAAGPLLIAPAWPGRWAGTGEGNGSPAGRSWGVGRGPRPMGRPDLDGLAGGGPLVGDGGGGSAPAGRAGVVRGGQGRRGLSGTSVAGRGLADHPTGGGPGLGDRLHAGVGPAGRSVGLGARGGRSPCRSSRPPARFDGRPARRRWHSSPSRRRDRPGGDRAVGRPRPRRERLAAPRSRDGRGLRKATGARLILACWIVLAVGPVAVFLWRHLDAGGGRWVVTWPRSGLGWLADKESRTWALNSAIAATLAVGLDLVILAGLGRGRSGPGPAAIRLALPIIEGHPTPGDRRGSPVDPLADRRAGRLDLGRARPMVPRSPAS